jgi:thiol-disulfide isomerase/thioredoxin
MKKLISFILMAALCSCINPEPVKTGKEGQPLPNFSLLLANGSKWDANKDLPTDKPFVVFYFSPHCPYCKAQTEELLKNMKKHNDVPFYLVTNYPFEEMKSYVDEYHLTKYPNITVGYDSSSFIAHYFKAEIVPFTAFYDKNRKLSEAFTGQIYSKQVLNHVNHN